MENTLTTLVARQAAKYGDAPAIYRRVSDENWQPISWNALQQMVGKVACALEIMGVEEQHKIAVFSANDPYILVTDYAAFANRIVPVSIYATSSEDQVEYIVRDSEAEMIFVGNEAQYLIAHNVKKRCGSLKQIVTYGNFKLLSEDKTTMSFSQLIELGEAASDQCVAEVERRRAQAQPEDVATLLYTSGTTGKPKGAILNHSCFDAAIEIHRERMYWLSDADTSLCFLPLSHIFEKAWTYLAMDIGIKIYVNEDPHIIANTIKEVHPNYMCAVPRFWEKAYNTIQDKLSRMRPISKIMAKRALKVGHKRNLDYVRLGKPVPFWTERKYQFYYKNVFYKVQRLMGVENGKMFPTAGAPLSSNIVEFFMSMGVDLKIGYGLSETTATVTCFPVKGFEIGTVGTPMPHLEVKIGENNEILVKGATVMQGYFKQPEETAAAFTADGFFRTGDAGFIDEHGALTITERIKDLFKTSNGKYVAPQAIESRLGEDKYIEQVAVIGDNRKFVSAIIVPALDALKEYAAKKKIQYKNLEDLLKNAQIKNFMASRIEALQDGLASFEKVKKFTLLPKQFTMENGELTNTLKICRPVINRHYASEIEAMYA